ncbi:hypothetical protein C8R45DRAFT_1209941, partial [Mycena sanguinolenta]
IHSTTLLQIINDISLVPQAINFISKHIHPYSRIGLSIRVLFPFTDDIFSFLKLQNPSQNSPIQLKPQIFGPGILFSFTYNLDTSLVFYVVVGRAAVFLWTGPPWQQPLSGILRLVHQCSWTTIFWDVAFHLYGRITTADGLNVIVSALGATVFFIFS